MPYFFSQNKKEENQKNPVRYFRSGWFERGGVVDPDNGGSHIRIRIRLGSGIRIRIRNPDWHLKGPNLITDNLFRELQGGNRDESKTKKKGHPFFILTLRFLCLLS